MVAIQKVEYNSRGEIAGPRKELLNIRRELNGEFSSNASYWHRHTIATESPRAFDQALARVKKLLADSGSEVARIERSGPSW